MAGLLQMRRTSGARIAASLCAAAALSWSSAAFAEQNIAAAANAFSRAQKAALSGDYGMAAELFELADELAPTPEALRSALGARRAQGRLATAASHAEELLRRYPDDAESSKLASDTLGEARDLYGRQQVSCRPEPCLLLVDGAPASAEPKPRHVVYLTPGAHSLVAVFGDRRTPAKSVQSAAGSEHSLSFEAPAVAATSPAPAAGGGEPMRDREPTSAGGGLSPWFFGIGAGVSVVLGAATIWSGLDTLSAHDDYEKNRTQAGYERGRDLELRTNLLLGATAVAAATTLTFAVLTDWSGSEPKPRARVSAGPALLAGSPALAVHGAF
jgi:tetratricopeptide (TPR) repeat protein